MFRNMIRAKQQLTQEECLEILKTEKRGVLSVLGDEGYPYGIPLNHYYNEADGRRPPGGRGLGPALSQRDRLRPCGVHRGPGDDL